MIILQDIYKGNIANAQMTIIILAFIKITAISKGQSMNNKIETRIVAVVTERVMSYLLLNLCNINSSNKSNSNNCN